MIEKLIVKMSRRVAGRNFESPCYLAHNIEQKLQPATRQDFLTINFSINTFTSNNIIFDISKMSFFSLLKWDIVIKKSHVLSTGC